MKLWMALVPLLVAAAGCVNRESQAQAKRTEELIADPTVPVSVTRATRETLVQTLAITGSIAATEDVAVGAKVAGRISAVYVRDGDEVRAGQIVAQIDPSDAQQIVRQALSGVSAARAQLQQALSNAAIGPARSEAAVEAARAQLRQAEEQLRKVRAGAREQERAQAQAAVNAARSNMETAKKALERAQRLFAEGALPRSAVEQAENAYQAALSAFEQAVQAQSLVQEGARVEDVRAAEEQVRLARENVRAAEAAKKLDVVLDQQVEAARAQVRAAEAQLALARQQLADTAIRSPFSGRVAGKPIQPGAVVAAGTPVCRIVGTEGIYFDAEIPEERLIDVRIGTTMEVRLDALPDWSTTGTIVGVNPVVRDVGRLASVRVRLASADPRIKPGMFARGQVEIRRIEGAIVVPEVAIVRRRGRDLVFVVEDSKARQIEVRKGLVSDGRVQVEGLAEGMNVVIRGQEQLSDGSRVRIADLPRVEEEGERGD